jgi:hypothetical protein
MEIKNEKNSYDERPEGKKDESPSAPLIRVSSATMGTLKSILDKLNSKSWGRKVRADDVIAKLLKKLNDVDFKDLQEASLSNTDRMERSFEEYCSKYGRISKDEYIGILMQKSAGAVPTK